MLLAKATYVPHISCAYATLPDANNDMLIRIAFLLVARVNWKSIGTRADVDQISAISIVSKMGFTHIQFLQKFDVARSQLKALIL